MSIRDTLQAHRGVTVAVALVAILGATAFVAWQLGRRPSPAVPGGFAGASKAYFSDDDGKSYFPDDGSKIPPILSPSGKTAYRAQVVRCGDGPPYVAYLERFSDADKKRLEDAIASSGPGGGPMILMNAGASLMVKRPGAREAAWVRLTPQTAGQFREIVDAKCPDGSPSNRVTPE